MKKGRDCGFRDLKARCRIGGKMHPVNQTTEAAEKKCCEVQSVRLGTNFVGLFFQISKVINSCHKAVYCKGTLVSKQSHRP